MLPTHSVLRVEQVFNATTLLLDSFFRQNASPKVSVDLLQNSDFTPVRRCDRMLGSHHQFFVTDRRRNRLSVLLSVLVDLIAAAAAVVLSAVGVTRMPQEATAAIGELWEVIALVCNSLLFLLVGLSVDLAMLGAQVGAIALAVLLVLAARAASVYTLVPAATRFFALPRVTMGERHIMSWGGLKGGLAIAMVLSIPQDLPGCQLLFQFGNPLPYFGVLVQPKTEGILHHA